MKYSFARCSTLTNNTSNLDGSPMEIFKDEFHHRFQFMLILGDFGKIKSKPLQSKLKNSIAFSPIFQTKKMTYWQTQKVNLKAYGNRTDTLLLYEPLEILLFQLYKQLSIRRGYMSFSLGKWRTNDLPGQAFMTFSSPGRIRGQANSLNYECRRDMRMSTQSSVILPLSHRIIQTEQ